MTYPSSTQGNLAAILGKSPTADVVLTMGELLDSLPIGVYVASCEDDLRVVYANKAAESWVPDDKLPVTGKLLEDTIELAEGNGFLEELGAVSISGQARHLRSFSVPGFSTVRPAPTDGSRWDFEVYPLVDSDRNVTHLLVCGAESDQQRQRTSPDHPEHDPDTDGFDQGSDEVVRMFATPSLQVLSHLSRRSSDSRR